jgi:fucose permease
VPILVLHPITLERNQTMAEPSTGQAGIHRRKLFIGICLALIPTGASFALVSNILIQLKEEFILTNYQVGLIGGAALWGMALSLLILGPLLEGFGMKNGTRLAFIGHLAGITLMLSAAAMVGSPSAFWILMLGAATLAMGNGMIEVAGNPLVAALYPEEKTTRLNYFHAFFPAGIVLGGIVGFLMANYGGFLGHWTYQIGIIYIPIAIYGWMVLRETFPPTENAAAGLPVREMFRYTLTSPLFLLILLMMATAISLELAPMRWIPAVLESAGMHGILVLVWISGWMVVLRLLAHHFVDKLAPTGMLLTAGLLIATGLFLLSFAEGLWTALFAATIFAWGVAFNFPTIVGLVAERLPKTGSLGIVLTAGVGLGAAGGIGVPVIGALADYYLPDALDPPATVSLLQQVNERFPEYLERAAVTDPGDLPYRERDVREAVEQTRAALADYEARQSLSGDITANALRAIVGSHVPNEPLVDQAAAILNPAEAHGGTTSFRYVAPSALLLFLVFGAMYLYDRSRGGYRAVRLEESMGKTAELVGQPPVTSETGTARVTEGDAPPRAPRDDSRV